MQRWKWKVYIFQGNSFLCICVIVPVTLKLFIDVSSSTASFLFFLISLAYKKQILSLVIKHIYIYETMFVCFFLYNFISDINNFVILDIKSLFHCKTMSVCLCLLPFTNSYPFHILKCIFHKISQSMSAISQII